MNDKYREQFLRHHGIPGMKWGVRKSNSSTKSDSKAGSRFSLKKERRMSNRELNARVKRLRLENEYKSLQKQAKPEVVKSIDVIVNGSGKVAKISQNAATIHDALKKMGLINRSGRS